MPQPPQFAESVIVFAQLPLQSVVPRGQRGTHWPFAHASPPGQTLPQAPQLFASLAKVAH